MESVAAARAAHFDAAGCACDHAALHASPERARIAACLSSLESFDLQRIAIPAQTAFWLNLFNAVVLRDAAELAAAGSLRAAESFFERPRLKVGTLDYSLDDIEHGLLRGNLPKHGARRPPMRRDDPRLAHMPLAYDERMHFAMYCVVRSSPPLNAFGAGRLDGELEDATARYLREHVRVESDGALVVLPRQLLWYADDFGGEGNALTFALARLDDETVDRVDRRRGRVKVRYADFDWRPNAQR
jgi:Protein of unknown function, DUF547